ncbi:hypothetical protein NM688_g1551 [Phlebia brevispora]|uniref:Uncharacterized protein n=1 Tax=Phlebia brevispora TaxID=194682 RepID=A0ACC1TBD1_9APHY|nr:hypothetical protein NM688_g1551 [Phlebia brevispora]
MASAEMAYQLYEPDTTLDQIANWHALLECEVDTQAAFSSEDQRKNLHQMFENTGGAIVNHMIGYTNGQIAGLNACITTIGKETAELRATVGHLIDLVQTQDLLIRQYQTALDKAELGTGGIKHLKLSDPPKYVETADKQGSYSSSKASYTDEYLDLLLKVYKAIYLDKSRTSVFGTSSGNGSSKDPDIMKIDAYAKSKSKGKKHQINSTETKKKHCLICAAKELKKKAQLHNTENCYDKPGNESKRPASKPTPASTAYEEDTATLAGSLHINIASIQELDDPKSAVMGTTAQVDEVQSGPSKKLDKGKKKVTCQVELDFPEGL